MRCPRAPSEPTFSENMKIQEMNLSTSELPQPDVLPAGLPAPLDDGRATHLEGLTLPPLVLQSTDGTPVQLDRLCAGRWVLFIYPTTGDPDAAMPQGWDEIPGARGCSQEACSFRDNLAALRTFGVTAVYALSSDALEFQSSLLERFHLSYPLVSDPRLELVRELKLPTFDSEGNNFYARLTMAINGSEIEHVFYPITNPATHADDVVEWYRRRAQTEGQ